MEFNELPVYRATYDLLVYVNKTSCHIRRLYRYTVWQDICTGLYDILTLIYRANGSYTKSELLTQACDHITRVKIHLRLLCDMKELPVKHYAFASEKAVSVSKQLTAWRKSSLLN
jgi:hypothetical protein